MSKAFYPKMALSNINKNRQTYFPYIITCILTIMMYFMMGSILHNENVRNMNHGDMVIVLLNIGMWVTMIFAVVFLFYTNSFLIKRRQKEIGLYNILGMEKRHIAKMMFYETLFTAVVSIGIGMLMGMLFGKLMFLLLIKLIGSSEIPAFQIPSEAVVNTLVTMALVFFAILLYNLARIHLTKPIELIHGGQIGEKEPKTKILRIVSDNRYEMAEEFHQMYGGFLFIGMFVGSLFLMATVLIIYYKQISEGYEDKARFEIMQKVGMSRAEVKKTIRSQVLMVFFIPLIMAAIHIVVSFRIIKMILSMLNLGNVNLFMWCTLGTVLVFCVIYAIVFAITERAYYKIVSIGNK